LHINSPRFSRLPACYRALRDATPPGEAGAVQGDALIRPTTRDLTLFFEGQGPTRIRRYQLERCKAASPTAPCTYALVQVLPANSTGLTDESVSGTGRGFYKYRVRADNAAGSSAWAETTVNAP
jgi:hypothetical protein